MREVPFNRSNSISQREVFLEEKTTFWTIHRAGGREGAKM